MKRNKYRIAASLLALGMAVVFFLPAHSSAMRLMSNEEALKQMLPGADKVTPEKRTLTAEETAAVKGKLGGTLVHLQRGAEAGSVKENLEYTFYFGTKGGQKTGVAVMDEQPGKWGPVEFIVALDPATGKVKNLAVLSYSEKRGRPIARRNFLDQFVGKGSADPIKVHKDIRPVSGATISSEATAFAVQKAVALYETLYLKK